MCPFSMETASHWTYLILRDGIAIKTPRDDKEVIGIILRHLSSLARWAAQREFGPEDPWQGTMKPVFQGYDLE